MFDKRLLQTLTMSGGRQEYLKKLLLDMEMDSIPVQRGGRYSGYNTPFTFDLSSSGPFYYSSCPYLSSAVVAPIATRSKEEDEQTEVVDSESSPQHGSSSFCREKLSLTEDSSEIFSREVTSPVLTGHAELTRSKSFKMKHIMRIFNPSSQSSSESSRAASSLPPSPLAVHSPSTFSPLTAAHRNLPQRQRPTDALDSQHERLMSSGRSDLETTTLPSDNSSDAAWGARQPHPRRPSRSHSRRRESSLSSLDSSALSPLPSDPDLGKTSHRHRSSGSRGSSHRSRRSLAASASGGTPCASSSASVAASEPSEDRRRSSRKNRDEKISEGSQRLAANHAGNTVAVGLGGLNRMLRAEGKAAVVQQEADSSLGSLRMEAAAAAAAADEAEGPGGEVDAAEQVRKARDQERRRRDRAKEKSRLLKVKAPRPGESIEQWKARVDYSSASAAASSGSFQRQCYSFFSYIDVGDTPATASSWWCI